MTNQFYTGYIAAAVFALGMTPALADFELNILHINDLHSRIESINKYDSTCSEKRKAKNECFGGIARVKAKIDERRSALKNENKNYLVLDAGDQFQGSLFYSTYKGKVAVEFMNQMGFDAMAIGNHEFDDGPQPLADFIAAAKFPVISGNTNVSAEPALTGKFPAYITIEKQGEKIAIVSVLATDTDETSSPGENVKFQNTVEYLTKVVGEIEASGINKIIALTHVGLTEDREIASKVSGIDVIVGGHSHTLLSNTAKRAKGPYPVIVQNPAGKNVPIVQAYAYSKYLGELKVTFDTAGEVVSASGDTVLLDHTVTPDAAFAARVGELAKPIEELKKQQVSSTTLTIDGDRNSCRIQECQMGNLVADAMLERVRNQGVTIAIQNSGGLRASIGKGNITMGDVLTVLPFQNTLSTFQLTGAQVIEALENGVSQMEKVAGRFPQVAGLKFSVDQSQPVGSRISEVVVITNDSTTPIEADKIYSVVSNNYMRSGGDGYKIFKTKGINAYDYGPGLEEVVATYLKNNQPYKPYVDGRISVK